MTDDSRAVDCSKGNRIGVGCLSEWLRLVLESMDAVSVSVSLVSGLLRWLH